MSDLLTFMSNSFAKAELRDRFLDEHVRNESQHRAYPVDGKVGVNVVDLG